MTALREVAGLRYRLKDRWRLAPYGQGHVALCGDGRRFALHPWQHAMLCAFDGATTFQQAASHAHRAVGGFTPQGLLNFYRWLNDEDLVLCLCDSVFELVDEAEPVAVEAAVRAPRAPSDLPSAPMPAPTRIAAPAPAGRGSVWQTFFADMGRCADRIVPRTPAQWRVAKLAATVLFSLAVLRLAYVAAPVFEPPANYAYAGFERWLAGGEADSAVSIAKSETEPEHGAVKEMEVAARAVAGAEDAAAGASRGPGPVEVLPEAGGAVGSGGEAASAETEAEETARLLQRRDDLERIEALRQKLSACRVRRDEFYLQNNEAGYREEVEKMTEITREIGEIEARL